MNSLKQLIITKSEKQRHLKNQRKTVNRVGDIDPVLAQARYNTPAQWAGMQHLYARAELRHLFIAYAILRRKDPKLAVDNYDPASPYEKREVDKIVDQYAAEFEAIYSDQQ